MSYSRSLKFDYSNNNTYLRKNQLIYINIAKI